MDHKARARKRRRQNFFILKNAAFMVFGNDGALEREKNFFRNLLEPKKETKRNVKTIFNLFQLLFVGCLSLIGKKTKVIFFGTGLQFSFSSAAATKKKEKKFSKEVTEDNNNKNSLLLSSRVLPLLISTHGEQ